MYVYNIYLYNFHLYIYIIIIYNFCIFILHTFFLKTLKWCGTERAEWTEPERSKPLQGEQAIAGYYFLPRVFANYGWRLKTKLEERREKNKDTINKLEIWGALRHGGHFPSEFICWTQICVGASKRLAIIPLCLAVFGRQSTTWGVGTSLNTEPVFSLRHLKYLPNHRPEG